MSAFLICDVTVKDRELLTEYLRLSQPTLEKFGGRFLAQAGETTVVEGNWEPKVIVIAEFPSVSCAMEWYHSADYAPALGIMPAAMHRNMIVTSGLR